MLVTDGVISAAYADEMQKHSAITAASSFFVNPFIISSLHYSVKFSQIAI